MVAGDGTVAAVGLEINSLGAAEYAHGAGQAGCLPAGRPSHSEHANYDHHSLQHLIGFLSVSDSQKMSQQAALGVPDAAAAWRDLEQRAKNEQWFLRMEEIEKINRIGEGQCAEVYKARWRGMHAVAKVLKRAGDYQAGWTLATARADLVHEISVLSHLRHPNLVLFLGACVDKDDVILLNEYMDGGNVEEYVQALKGRHPGRRACVTRKSCAQWSVHLAQALTFLHACDPPVIHRDLKPANLLLCSQGHLKVADFGLSSAKQRTMIGSEAYLMTGRTGTIRYMAPEAMMVDDEGNSCYNENVDCYSAAMVMWYICMADKPFGDLDADLIMAGAANGLRPDLASIRRRHGEHMADTIQMCWDGDPTKRADANTLLERMRLQLQYINEKKALRRKLLPAPVTKIYKWASSAASRLFVGRHAKDKAHSSAGPADADARVSSQDIQAPFASKLSGEVCCEEVVNPPVHHQRRGETRALERASSELDSTVTTTTTTGTWSLDTTANNWSLDNTAQTTSSVRSNEDWFSQIASEKEKEKAADARPSEGEGRLQGGVSRDHSPQGATRGVVPQDGATVDGSLSRSSGSSRQGSKGSLELTPERVEVKISTHLSILAGEEEGGCEGAVPPPSGNANPGRLTGQSAWFQVAFDVGGEGEGGALEQREAEECAGGAHAQDRAATWAQVAFDLPR